MTKQQLQRPATASASSPPSAPIPVQATEPKSTSEAENQRPPRTRDSSEREAAFRSFTAALGRRSSTSAPPSLHGDAGPTSTSSPNDFRRPSILNGLPIKTSAAGTVNRQQRTAHWVRRARKKSVDDEKNALWGSPCTSRSPSPPPMPVLRRQSAAAAVAAIQAAAALHVAVGMACGGQDGTESAATRGRSRRPSEQHSVSNEAEVTNEASGSGSKSFLGSLSHITVELEVELESNPGTDESETTADEVEVAPTPRPATAIATAAGMGAVSAVNFHDGYKEVRPTADSLPKLHQQAIAEIRFGDDPEWVESFESVPAAEVEAIGRFFRQTSEQWRIFMGEPVGRYCC